MALASHTYRTAARVTGVVAASGIGYLAYQGLQKPIPTSLSQEKVQTRLRETFASIGAGVAITTASAVATFRSSRFQNKIMPLMGRHPILATIGSLCLVIVPLVATVATPKDNKIAKYACYAAFTGAMGCMLAPIGVLGGPVLAHAGICTVGLVGGLGIIGATMPREQFLSWEGPAAVGLGVVCAASLGALIFPSIGAFGAISLYGGMILFSGLVMADTAKLLKNAETATDESYDPINEGLNIYLDSVNLFVRIAEIMAKSKSKSTPPSSRPPVKYR